MPDITIVKLKIRRGTDAQRKSVILEQGELGYTIDTQRVFVGNGILSGGSAVGSVVHPPLVTADSRLSQNNAVKGDIVYENSVLWQLSGNSYASSADWANISPKGDNIYISPNASNQLTIKASSITPDKLASTIVFNQGGLNTNSSGLSANVDGTYMTISANKITLTTVNENVITSSSLGRGLSGGSGNKLAFFGNSDVFAFNGNETTIKALPNGVVSVPALSSNFAGAGLSVVGNSLIVNVNTYDTLSCFNVDSNTLRLKSIISPGTTTFSNIGYDGFGRITQISPAVVDGLSGNNSRTSQASAAAIFNGSYDQTEFTNQTILTAMSSNSNFTSSVAIALTSAGFMSFYTSIGLVAVPIFTYNP